MDENYKHPANEKKIKFKTRSTKHKHSDNVVWVLIITCISFIISGVLSFFSSKILEDSNIFVAFGVVVLIIAISVVSDIIGTASTAADETPYHAMASRKLYGAREAIWISRNANKVSSFCNDVIGDICGVISGAAAAYIIMSMVGKDVNGETTIQGLAITGLVAAMTVGGKSSGKAIAIQNSNYIVFKVAIVLKFINNRLRIFKFFKVKKNRLRFFKKKKYQKQHRK